MPTIKLLKSNNFKFETNPMNDRFSFVKMIVTKGNIEVCYSKMGVPKFKKIDAENNSCFNENMASFFKVESLSEAQFSYELSSDGLVISSF